MHYDEFIGEVRARGALPDRRTAERAVRATLETLAERVPVGLAEHIAAQLPPEIAQHLLRVAVTHGPSREERRRGERFGLAGFAGRIAWRAGTTEEMALAEAGAVLDVLDASLAPELMQKLGHVLPHDIRELLPEARAADAPWSSA
ncbi:DUF2267 domain-containing protein [Peterkaempfera bronchialis]|uniref:DUF2267 domain-containing protein n=1 Tax=Peterkaempfera bronchialis TaxID=2126346 RepID=A0A345SS66_9ACTN|nr:DUF2267 domain-containing protein [Peterkaempfera bronchialis]AXI76571.1 DUF2267 domain-containing protein [Peterkaempfera bronchialis]